MSDGSAAGGAGCTLEDVLITDRLALRPRAPDYEAEARALGELARELAANPRGLLQKVVETARELCRADSAGVAILEPGGEHGIFRWHAIAGAFAPSPNGTMPRETSPWRDVMRSGQVLLLDHAERFFPALRGVEPPIHESLLAPWHAGGRPAGTLWLIAHTPGRHFDAEDARLLRSLSCFAAAAWQTALGLEAVQTGRDELEWRVEDRTRGLRDSTERLRGSEARLTADLAGMRRLYALHARIATETDLKVALDEILAAACELTHTGRGCVQLVSGDGQRLEMFTWRGYADASPFIEHFRHEGFAEGYDAARVERRRLIIEDTRIFPGLAGTACGAAALADGILAAQSTPMVSRIGETVGVLSTQFGQPHRPGEDALLLVDLLAWTAADFVERHRARVALHESESRFRAIANLVPELLWQSEPGGSTTWHNDRWYAYTGQTPEQAAGFGWTDAIHPADREESAANWMNAMETGTPLVQENRIRGADGEYRWFLVRSEPIRGDGGRIVRWAGAATDVHAQRLELQEVERRVAERTAELARANAALQAEVAGRARARAAREALLRQLTTAVEDERRRISRELHDQLGQLVTGLQLGLRALRGEMPAQEAGRVAALEELARRIARQTQHLALELRPPALDSLGLAPALRGHLEEWGARHGMECDFHALGLDGGRLAPEVETTVYRVVQEGLTNVLKHARARRVSLLLERRDGWVRAVLEDDGAGFDVDAALATGRLGLRGMRERLALLGGTLEVESGPGQGTTLFARVPLGTDARRPGGGG